MAKLDASKENAREARIHLTNINDRMPEALRKSLSGSLVFLDDFLASATSRLPGKKAIDNDRKRKKIYAKKTPAKT